MAQVHAANLSGQDTIESFIREFPNREQVKMMTAWLEDHEPHLNPDSAFGRRSGDVGDITLAGAVMLGQLGTPSDTVRYGLILADEHGQPFNGHDTYVLTVPAGIVHDDGYFSVTVYGTDDKLLIENDLGIYDRTTYSATAEPDGTYTITLSPTGQGVNGIPTGKPFYGILRAYVPVPGADLTVVVRTVG